jgi:hypothetical protein
MSKYGNYGKYHFLYVILSNKLRLDAICACHLSIDHGGCFTDPSTLFSFLFLEKE